MSGDACSRWCGFCGRCSNYPEHGANGRRPAYRCVTCDLKTTAASSLLHIAHGHTVVNRKGDVQQISETTKRLALEGEAEKKVAV